MASWSLAFAQSSNYTIRGTVQDNDSGSALPGATIMLLEAKDSVMNSYAITNTNGEYTFKKIKPGQYVIQVSFLGYHTYFRKIEATGDQQNIELSPTKLLTENTLLDGVVVEGQHIPIMIKGDTIEYNSAAFKTQANATVEDLLKKLPGIEVETDGTIKAHGEEVQKVLVDGKEFFGDDPKIATRNLPADVVDKVQVFDKMSELAEFSGVDDGERDKTINLSLKDDKKKGTFGNISAGYGSNDRYEAKATINRFKKNTQISFLGAANNVNQRGFTQGSNFHFGGGGMMVIGEGLSGSGSGITETLSAGLNMNHDFSKKTDMNLSYFYNDIENTLEQVSTRQNFANIGTFNSTGTDNTINENLNHRFNYRLRHKFSDVQELSIRGNFDLSDGLFSSSSTNSTFNTNEELSNTAVSDNNGNGDDYSFSSAISWRRKFVKPGRNLVIDGDISTGNNNQNTSLLSNNQYQLDDPLNTFAEVIRQEQPESTSNNNYGLKISYTEPLGKKKYLQFSYNWKNYQNDVIKDFYDVDNSGIQTLDPNLSSNYNRGFYYNIAGAKLMVNREKYNFSVGSNFQMAELNGELVTNEVKINKNFDAVLPNMQFKYSFATSHRISLNYTTRLQEPSITQLQPTTDNSNPLNIYTGNPDLKAAYVHNVRLFYMLFNQFSYTNVFAMINASYTKDKITNATSYDAQLRQLTQPINVDKDYTVNGYVSFGTPLKFIGSKIDISGNVLYNNGIQFISTQENSLDRWIYGTTITLGNRKKEVFDVRSGVNYSYNTTQYSLNNELNQEFLTTAYFGEATVNFMKRFELSSSMRYTIYEGDAFGGDREVPIWRAHFAANFLKYDKGQLKLSVFDILNENVGIDRSSSLNYIEDKTYTSLARYWMLTFTYSLSQFGESKRKGRGFMLRGLH